jgi:F-type H+-transporting ATPase subunit gamma
VRRELELQRRLRSLDALGATISAMKSLSAHHFRDAREAVEASRLYRQGVEQILAEANVSMAAGARGCGLLVLGGELGLCGAYNAQVVASAARRREELGAGPTLCVGRRAASLLGRRGLALRTYAAPTSVRGSPELLVNVVEDVLTSYVQEQLAEFEVVSVRFEGVGSNRPTVTRLLPLENTRSEQSARVRYVSALHLMHAVVREVLYIEMYDLLLDALAAEHAARLVATQSAERWLSERSERTRRQLASAQRETSTQEVIEIAGGARHQRSSR